MRTGLLISLAVATILAVGFLSRPEPQHKNSLFTLEEVSALNSFTLWTSRFGRQYFSDEEKTFRHRKYLDNQKFVKEHNKRFQQGQETYQVELNGFADMDIEEFSSKFLGLKKSVDITKKCDGSVQHVDNPPAEFDWEPKGAVGKVHNQGSCGSCWAFSAIGALEGLAYNEKGSFRDFSPQQLVDCSTKKDYGNEGCNGGEMNAAFWYVIDHGLTTEASYPYAGKTQTCRYTASMEVYRIKSCAEVPANKTSALVDAVLASPVSISVQANQAGFQLYKSGVFSGTCGHKLDHGIVLTGYGQQNGKDFWKAKNSWGSSWGLHGYILFAKGADGPGQCGILMENTIPLTSV